MAVAYEFTASDQPQEIIGFVHCGKCIQEKPKGVSPSAWAQLEVGYTKEGIQVWCRRHEINVVHLKWAKDSYSGADVEHQI